MINLLSLDNFYPVISYRRVRKESDESYTIRSLVMVRKQLVNTYRNLPAQVVNTYRNIFEQECTSCFSEKGELSELQLRI